MLGKLICGILQGVAEGWPMFWFKIYKCICIIPSAVVDIWQDSRSLDLLYQRVKAFDLLKDSYQLLFCLVYGMMFYTFHDCLTLILYQEHGVSHEKLTLFFPVHSAAVPEWTHFLWNHFDNPAPFQFLNDQPLPNVKYYDRKILGDIMYGDLIGQRLVPRHPLEDELDNVMPDQKFPLTAWENEGRLAGAAAISIIVVYFGVRALCGGVSFEK
uniref:Uncharacterized protein n=1 Tax=Ishige okamurae TaxID=233772 RepID=A0A4Y5T7M0_9PHAE|nr:hypothetical protein [Ishige okamurae]